jgi:thiamine biosynthesis protein ThiI
MNDANAQTVLVRLSAELTTKSRGTRRRFMRRLVENIRDAFRSNKLPVHVEAQWTRLFVRTASPEAVPLLSRIPGISSLSMVEGRVPAELDPVVRRGTELFAERVRGRSYAVRARRAGSHPFSSFDVQRTLGAALNPGARVDLRNPEVEVEVEVRDRWAYLFSGRTPGLGGLPLGVEGRAVCLLSGGFDSAAAAWLMLKRGVALEYVFCNLAGAAYERSVVEVGRVLAKQWSHGTRPRLHVVEFGPVVDELRTASQPKYWQLVLKRLMYRAAAEVARETGAVGIVTGESIGQVSSQTLANLAAIQGAVDLPVFRPLIGFDKADIVELTRRVGTYELSSRVREYCAIAPGNPVTSATPRATGREEQKLDAAPLAAALRDRRVVSLYDVGAAELVDAYLFTDTVPEDAVVVDLRPSAAWEDWHYPGAIQRDPWQLTGSADALDREQTYVLYCEASTQSAVLAEQLQKLGMEAYAFRGGVGRLRTLAGEERHAS